MRAALLASLPLLSLFAAGCGGGDSSINSSIKMQLLTQLRTHGLYIRPHTSGGVVTLTGGVVSTRDREEAVRIARATAGVRDVRDEMANRQNF